MELVVDDQPADEFYDSISTTYQSAFAHDAGLLSYLGYILTLIPPSSTVLDIGCGTGTPVASTLASAGHQVVGIDIAPSMVAASRKAVPSGDFSIGDMRSYVPREKVPVVLNILSVFLLSPQELEVMSHKWSEWLLPGGLLCISVIAAEDLNPTKDMYDADELSASGMKMRFMGRTVELTLLSRKGWRTMLQKAGFEVVREQTEWFEPPPEAQSDAEAHYFITARNKA
ncbi:MAG: hypothetical protein Q9191_006733 [Dirinaria sp. TL-2023a]